MAERPALPRWARWTAAACSVAVVGAGAYLVVDAVPSSAATSALRTATVATGSVTQSISLSGSVERVDQVTATFRTAGTVTSVKVSVGDEVEAGDVLATLGTDDLERAVTVAQANLVAAQASLDAASSATASSQTASSSTSAASSAAASPSTGSGSGSGSTPAPSATRAPSPKAPKVDTSGAHRAVGGFDALVAAAVTACQPLVDGGTPPGPGPKPTPTPTPSPSATTSPTPSPSPTPTPSQSPSATASPTGSASPSSSASPTASSSGAAVKVDPASLTTEPAQGPTPEQVTACISALSRALGSAQRTAAELGRLVTALDAATKALQQQQSTAATQSPTGTAPATGSAGNAASGGAGTPSPAAAGGSGSRSSASLEVAVLEATQQLASAEQDLDAAVLEAPIGGRVGQVDLVAGEPASTSTGVVLVGPGAAVVTVDLPLAQLGKVRVAQEVGVTPAGTTDEAAGLVQSIGVLPTSTTSSSPSYPVRVTVSEAPVTLAAGSTATATITLATASDVLTVPVSAVTGVSAGTGTVQVLSSGSVKVTTVTIGAVGQGKVHVEDGLSAGQVVVLADPTTALPTSNGSFRRPTTGGVSGLTGGPGGGFGGRPPG